jgi:hypothetical protein
LKLKYDGPLPTFAFTFNLCRYNAAAAALASPAATRLLRACVAAAVSAIATAALAAVGTIFKPLATTSATFAAPRFMSQMVSRDVASVI